MDAVPCSTPVAHIQKSRKKIRSFPLINGESEEKILENAKQSDELVPIRLDMEIEGTYDQVQSGRPKDIVPIWDLWTIYFHHLPNRLSSHNLKLPNGPSIFIPKDIPF